MNNYTVKFFTTEGSVVAINVQANSAMEAQQYAEGMPNFASLYYVDWN